VEIQGVSTYVVDAGEGPTVLLIHGYGDTADGWRRIVPNLLRDHRVVALDVPPFGRSDDIKPPKLMEFYKSFFPEFFKAMGIDKATLIGHSLGGAITLHLALEQPELIARIGLVAPAGLGEKPPRWWHTALGGYGPIYKTALSIPTPITGPLVRAGMNKLVGLRLFHDRRGMAPDIEHLLELHSSRRDLDRLLAAGRCCVEAYTGRLLEDSKSIDVPKFMVWGRHDGLVPSEHARAFASLHPDAHVHVIDDCGHYPQIEFPQRVNHLLRRWLDETAAAKQQQRPRLRAVA
jgi:pimeloyl-ACP methyl ester carboxylesterase